MRDTEQIISTAFNFGQQYSAGMETRTGMFHVGITLGRLGEGFELKAGYSHLRFGNEGFGVGWSLNVSRYDPAQKRLSLSDGSSYRVTISRFSSEVECQYLKLQDIKVTLQNEVLQVNYKDGSIEQFDRNGFLRSYTLPSGHVFRFTYRGTRLERVTNQSNLSLTLTYSESGVIVTSPNGIDKVLVRVSGRLTDAILPDGTSYQIRYRVINGLYVVEYLNHPTGATEKLTYDAAGMRLPAGGPVSSLPAVIMHETYGTDVPRMTRNYRYSGTNFLGNGLSRYTADIDNLFETASNYTYTCTETFGYKEVTRTYNKFHLLTKESVLALPERQLKQETVVEYYADTSKIFASQPDQYLLPRKQTVTYYNRVGEARAEVTEFEYDSYGNELRKLDAFGIETYSVYYPADGESGVAPAAPAGIPFLIQSQTVTPSVRKVQGGEVAQISTYTYGLHPALQGGKSYPVKIKELIATANGRELATTTFTYVNNPSEPESHGALLLTETCEGELKTSVIYSYSLRPGVSLSSQATYTFGDGLSYTEAQEISLHCGKQLSRTDRLRNKTTWEYDGLDRVVKEMVRVGSQFEQTTTYRYALGESSQLDIDVSDGTRRRVMYDQLGRAVANYATDCSGNLVLMSKLVYNTEGQVSTRILYDDCTGVEAGLTTHLSYDIWGEVSAEELEEQGVTKVTERDKANNSQIQFMIAGEARSPAVKTYYDERGEVIKVSVDNYDLHTITYNGFGVEVERTELHHDKTTIELDDIGRAVSKRKGDQTVTQTFTNDNRALVTEMTVAGSVVGKREYDSLGRVTSETKGGVTTSYRYDTLADKPSVITLESGDTINYTLSLELGEITGITTNDDNAYYAFDTNGRLVRASNNATTQQYTYHYNGELKSESIHDKTASYTYSRQGQLLTLTDYMGNVEQRSYDRAQRLQRVVLGETSVTLSYDAFGRLRHESITSPTNPLLEHSYSYDARGYLEEKKTTSNGVHHLSQEYTYLNGMRLHKKFIKDAAGQWTEEIYHYDGLGRLYIVGRHNSGSANPDYLGIGNLLSQSFGYDIQGNISNMTTNFIKGNEQRENLTHYAYDNGRLVKVRHSLPELPTSELTYDKNGNLTYDEEGRRYSYNVQGQLTSIAYGENQLSAYTYSANGQQVQQTVPGQPDIKLFYGLGHLLNESQGMVNSRTLIVGGRPVSRLVTTGGVVTETGLVTDYKGTVLSQVCGRASKPLVYTSYGDVSAGTATARKRVAAIAQNPANTDFIIYWWSDGSYSDWSKSVNRFVSHCVTLGGWWVSQGWPADKRVVAIGRHPTTTALDIYYWSDGSFSTFDIKSKMFRVHYDANSVKPQGDWPAGKYLATIGRYPGYESNWDVYYWSDGSFSTIKIGKGAFYAHYSATDQKLQGNWPSGKQLAAIGPYPGHEGSWEIYYWSDGSFSSYEIANKSFNYHYSATDDKLPVGWPTASPF